MNVRFNILASCSIKRKKPWRKVTWFGKEKENLLLLDKQRLSILDPSSGRTKKRLGSVNAHLKDAVAIGLSANGSHLFLLLHTGDIVLWCKDLDTSEIVKGLPQFKSAHPVTLIDKKTPRFPLPDVYVSSDAKQIVVILGKSKIYLWQSCNLNPEVNPIDSVLHPWLCIKNDPDVFVPSIDCQDAVIEVVFAGSDVFSQATITCAFVFGSGSNLCTNFCLLSKSNDNSLTATWKQRDLSYLDLGRECTALHKHGSLVARLSDDGRLLAVAVNQDNLKKAVVLFISSSTGEFYAVPLHNAENSTAKHVFGNRRYYWISDMSWTIDNTCLVCIMRHGSICVISRLGHLVQISAAGFSMDLGPSFYMKLYPLAVLKGKLSVKLRETDTEDDSSPSVLNSLHQVFSISAHRSAPLFIASDGYLVTVFQLPESMTNSMHFIRSFCLFSKETLAPLLREYLPQSEDAVVPESRFRFAYASNSYENLDSTVDTATSSSIGDAPGPIIGMDSGRISFGLESFDTDSGSIVPSAFITWERHFLQLVAESLISAWAMAASVNTLWSEELELLCRSIVWMMQKTIMIILNQKFVLPYQQEKFQHNSPVTSILNLLSKCLQLVKFDHPYLNLLPLIIQLIHSTCKTFLTSTSLVSQVPRFQVLRDVLTLLNSTEESLKTVYLYGITSNATSCESCYSLYASQGKTNDDASKSQVLRRLQCIWSLLYRHAARDYKLSRGKSPQALELLCIVQKAFQDRDYNLTNKVKMKRKDLGILKYLSGHKRKAIQAWIKTAEKQQSVSASEMHRILYALLLHGDVKGALEFTYKMMSNGKCTKKSRENIFQLIVGLDKPNVSSLVSSLARFVASYFGNTDLFVFPVTNPKPLPCSSHDEQRFVTGDRLVPVSSQFLTRRIYTQRLESMVNPNMVLELFLFSGLWAEAVDFGLKMGHWKIAFFIALLQLKLFGESCRLEHDPQSILVAQLLSQLEEKNVSTVHSFRSSEEERSHKVENLHRMFIPALVCDIDVVPTLISVLMEKLKRLLSGLSLLVSTEIYLPAPPIFCPQTSVGYEENDIPKSHSDAGHRHAVSKVIADIFCIIQAANLDVWLLACYMSFLHQVWLKLNLDVKGLNSLDHLTRAFHGGSQSYWNSAKNSVGLQQSLQHLRELCSLLWFMTCRDNLSLACRNLQNHMLSCHVRLDKSKAVHESLCQEVLQWAINILPFQEYISISDSLPTLVVNTVWDLTPTNHIVECVAKFFLHESVQDAAVKQKFTELQEKWRIKTESNDSGDNESNKGSSDLRLKASASALFVLTLKAEKSKHQTYDNRVNGLIANELNQSVVQFSYKRYQFETDFLYISFLESIFQIGILKHLQSDTKQVPYLVSYSQELRDRNFHDYATSLQILQSHEKPPAIFRLSQLSFRRRRRHPNSLRESVLFCRKTRGSSLTVSKDKQLHVAAHLRDAKAKKPRSRHALKKSKSLATVLEVSKHSKKLFKSTSAINLNVTPTASLKKPVIDSTEQFRVLTELLPSTIRPLVCLYAWLHRWLSGKVNYIPNESNNRLSPVSPSVIVFLMLCSDKKFRGVEELHELYQATLLNDVSGLQNGDGKLVTKSHFTRTDEVRPEAIVYIDQNDKPSSEQHKNLKNAAISSKPAEQTIFFKNVENKMAVFDQIESPVVLRNPIKLTTNSDDIKCPVLGENDACADDNARISHGEFFPGRKKHKFEDENDSAKRNDLDEQKENEKNSQTSEESVGALPVWSRYKLPQVYLERWEKQKNSTPLNDNVDNAPKSNRSSSDFISPYPRTSVTDSKSCSDFIIKPQISNLRQDHHFPRKTHVEENGSYQNDPLQNVRNINQSEEMHDFTEHSESRDFIRNKFSREKFESNDSGRRNNVSFMVEEAISHKNLNNQLVIDVQEAFRAELRRMAEQLNLGTVERGVSSRTQGHALISSRESSRSKRGTVAVATQTFTNEDVMPVQNSADGLDVSLSDICSVRDFSEDLVTNVSSEQDPINHEPSTNFRSLFKHLPADLIDENCISKIPLLKLNVPPQPDFNLKQELIRNNMEWNNIFNKCPDKLMTVSGQRKWDENNPPALLKLEEQDLTGSVGTIVTPVELRKYLQQIDEDLDLEPVRELCKTNEQRKARVIEKLLYLTPETTPKEFVPTARKKRTRRKTVKKTSAPAKASTDEQPRPEILNATPEVNTAQNMDSVIAADNLDLNTTRPQTEITDYDGCPPESFADIQHKMQTILYKPQQRSNHVMSTQTERLSRDAEVNTIAVDENDNWNSNGGGANDTRTQTVGSTNLVNVPFDADKYSNSISTQTEGFNLSGPQIPEAGIVPVTENLATIFNHLTEASRSHVPNYLSEQTKESKTRRLMSKLNEMQHQLQAIENVSANVEKEFIATKEVLKEAEKLSSKRREILPTISAPFSILLDKNENEEKLHDEKDDALQINSFQLVDLEKAQRRRTQQQLNFEQRKRAILDMIAKEDSGGTGRGISTSTPVEKQNLGKTQSLGSGRKRISFGNTETFLVPSYGKPLNRTFKVADRRNCGDALPPLQSSRVYQKKQSEKDEESKSRLQEDESQCSSDTNSPWEIPPEISTILYGNEQL